MKDGSILSWLLSAQPSKAQVEQITSSSRINGSGHVSKPEMGGASGTAKVPRSATTVQKKARSQNSLRGRGKDKTPRVRRTRVQLQCERLQRARNADGCSAKVDERGCLEEHAVSLPVEVYAPEACLPAEATSESINNSVPVLTPTLSPTPESNPPDTHPHLLEATFQQQQLEKASEQETSEGSMSKQRITMRSKRGKAKKLGKARRGGAKAVIIKSESVDVIQHWSSDSAYGSSNESLSGFHSKFPPPMPWTGRRTSSIINLVALCTYPGQTIEPESVDRLFTLQHEIDAAMHDQGPPVEILRNLPRDITLTVERKEAIWLAQGKLNREVEEVRRTSRRQQIDRYVPADRWVQIDRYVPDAPYDPNSYTIPVMRLHSRTEP
jgi:hypothetical protein